MGRMSPQTGPAGLSAITVNERLWMDAAAVVGFSRFGGTLGVCPALFTASPQATSDESVLLKDTLC